MQSKPKTIETLWNSFEDKIKYELGYLYPNNLSNASLVVGQKLIIPSTSTYIVQKGDSLYKIANKFNTSVEQLKNKNNLNTNVLQIGQVLNI